jgi:hypothetical protein
VVRKYGLTSGSDCPIVNVSCRRETGATILSCEQHTEVTSGIHDIALLDDPVCRERRMVLDNLKRQHLRLTVRSSITVVECDVGEDTRVVGKGILQRWMKQIAFFEGATVIPVHRDTRAQDGKR